MFAPAVTGMLSLTPQAKSLSGAARWEGGVLKLEEMVMEQADSR
jgi:hypothetical protein